ncbi:MAG: DUF5672 family protein [Thiotrichales bacterium]
MISKAIEKRVAIAVPWFDRGYILESEKTSLRHLKAHLGKYDAYLIIPEGLDFELEGLETRTVNKKYFGSVKAHNRMLLSKEFYKIFDEYEFLLIYHPDALVFSDQMEYWCNQGYDYIAPPWIVHPDTPYHGNKVIEGGVGNSGFSLRNLRSIQKVLRSKKIGLKPKEEADYDFGGSSNEKFARKVLRKVLTRVNFFPLERRYYVDDLFWGLKAKYYDKNFKVAPVDVALKFAFECVPRYCFEKNNNVLPFGCHAWEKYDPEFWAEYIIPERKISQVE